VALGLPSRMRICHVTTLHQPDDARIVVRECATLAAAGHDVHLVARAGRAQEHDGVAYHPAEAHGSVGRRLAAALTAARRVGADAYHLHDPELIPVGVALKAAGARVVYDAHEDTPQEVADHTGGLAGRLLPPAWTATEAAAGRLFDGIVAATPTIARRFPARKTVLVRNFPVRREAATFAGPPLAEREPVAVYVGGVTAARGAPEMVRAIERVGVAGARLALVGDFQPAALRAELEALAGWGRVTALGRVSREGVADALRSARVGLAVLQPLATHLDALPVKLFEYMAAGIPVVASDFPLWREIVEPEGCGVLVDPQDVGAIAAAVERLLVDPVAGGELGARGRAAFERTYSWDAEGERLVALYERLGR
jgi:glycosyltransferase involved in cell wall biosynthesis